MFKNFAALAFVAGLFNSSLGVAQDAPRNILTCSSQEAENPAVVQIDYTGSALATVAFEVTNRRTFMSTYDTANFWPLSPTTERVAESLTCYEVDHKTGGSDSYIHFLCASTQFLGAPPFAKVSASELESVYQKGVAAVNAGSISALVAYRGNSAFGMNKSMEVFVRGSQQNTTRNVLHTCEDVNQSPANKGTLGFEF